jgi:hypothetical protein
MLERSIRECRVISRDVRSRRMNRFPVAQTGEHRDCATDVSRGITHHLGHCIVRPIRCPNELLFAWASERQPLSVAVKRSILSGGDIDRRRSRYQQDAKVDRMLGC